MELKLSLHCCLFLATVLVNATASFDAGVDKRSHPDSESYPEGIVEAYMMARDTVQDLVDKGVSPDPNGDEMRALRYWREKLKNRSDFSQEDLMMILKGDPGIDNSIDVSRSPVDKRTIESRLSKRRPNGILKSDSGIDNSDSVLESRVDKRTIESDPSKRWTGGIVPFIYTNDANTEHQKEIKRAMEHYHRFSCIRFVPWETANGTTTNQKLGLDHPGYLKFVVRNGCWSHQGNYRWADGQEISCCSGGSCVHELGHALGMLHEHQSPNPDRNRFIRVNPQYITGPGQQWYVQKEPGNFNSQGYDLNSLMHYSQTFYAKGQGQTYTILFPELSHGGSFYYHVREVSTEHKCQDQCEDFPFTCENDGYLTKVDGKCACRCIPGLDPETGCRTTYRHDPPGLQFPGGQYGLPAYKDGCPDVSFATGTRTHYNDGGNDKSEPFSLEANVTDNMVSQSFCISSKASNGVIWPEGNYCIYRKGGSCPDGLFSEGSVKYGDNPTDENPNSSVGELPDGEYDDDTKYQFCCKNTGFNDDVLFLPSRKPFALVKRRDQKCQNVRGMHLEVNSVTVHNALDDMSRVDAAVSGDHPVVSGNGKDPVLTISYCVYKPAMINCGEVYELNPTHRELTFSSPHQTELECYWLLKAPRGQRLALDFTEFDIKGFPGMCEDDLVVRYSRQGQPGMELCGMHAQKTIISLNNTIHIRLSTYSDYISHFTAKVRLVLDEDLCYNRDDRGMTYDGDIDFTRAFQPCLPWHEMTHCEAHPFNLDIYNTLLIGNQCRTPDQATAFQPWCYTDKEFCTRDYCDVCLIGKLVDRVLSCEETLAAGKCNVTSSFNCAKTCFDKAPPIKAIDVQCPTPPDVYDGKPVSPKASYAVGEAATYKCNYMDVTQERLCLSSGTWAPMGTVCTECPRGWHMKADTRQCYRYFDKPMNYSKAVEKCQALNANMTTAKSEEENSFILSLTSSPAWLGLTDDKEEGKFVWVVDGTEMVYSNWDDGEPNNWNDCQDCVELTTDGKWNDRNCENHYSVLCKRPAQDIQFCLDFWHKCRNHVWAFLTTICCFCYLNINLSLKEVNQ